jgi:hypothetical protein
MRPRDGSEVLMMRSSYDDQSRPEEIPASCALSRSAYDWTPVWRMIASGRADGMMRGWHAVTASQSVTRPTHTRTA